MATGERRYLLPCTCAHRVPVGAGQAGGRVACPACGRELDVPRLRDLGSYAVTRPADAAAAVRPVGPARGVAIAAAAVAVVAGSLAASVVHLGGFFCRQPPGPTMIRAAVEAAPPVQVQAMWQTLSKTGVRRPVTDEEFRLQQFAAHAAGVAWFLWAVAGAAAVIAAVGTAMAMSARRGASGSPA